MPDTKYNISHLYTALEFEKLFGEKYFYRQRIYRLSQAGKIITFNLKDKTCYLGDHIIQAFVKDLELRIASQFPEISIKSLRIFYDLARGKKMVVDGLFGKGVSVDTDKETEEDLLKKISGILEWVGSNADEQEKIGELEEIALSETQKTEKLIPASNKDDSLAQVLPEEIQWVKVNAGSIEGIDVKSYILVSLPSIAQFIGIRPDKLITWLSNTTFADFVLSAHYKHLQGTQIRVPWKKGIVSGYTPLIPFELLPEIIVSFRQSGRSVDFPEKAQMLYDLAENTLKAVGLAMSGDKNLAAQELARVGKGLGLTVADQIIGIFKQYESRDYQIQTNKEFNSKVKALGANYAVMTGTLTLGITGRYVEQWKALGLSRSLPSKNRASSREVMRKLSPSDGVGMTFGERHFIKDPNVDEAIRTGKQGKGFYERLKKVGLLND